MTRSIERIDAATASTSAARAARAHDRAGLRRRLAAASRSRLAGGIAYGAARSEAPNTHGLDVHIVGAGNSAGQAALFFSTHARSVTIVCRGDSLEKSMSRYLVDQLAARGNIGVRFGYEVAAAHGDASLEAIEIRGPRTARPSGSPPAGCSCSSAPTRRPAGSRPRSASTRAATSDRPGDARRGAVDAGPRPLPAGDERARDLRVRRRPPPVKRVAAAVGEGSMVIAFVHQYLKDAGASLVG